MVQCASFQTRRLQCILATKSQDHCMYHGSSLAACSGGNTIPCPSPKNPTKVPDNERKNIADWEFEDLAAWYLLSQRLPNSITIWLQSLTTAKSRWDRLIFKFTAQSVYVQNDLEEAFFNMACTKGEDIQVFLTALLLRCCSFVRTAFA